MRKLLLWSSLVLFMASVMAFPIASRAVAKQVVIKVWDWQVQDNYMNALEKILSMFEAKYPNVRIKRKVIVLGEYEKQIKVAFVGGEAPDLFQVHHGAQLEAYYKSGLLHDFLNDWKADAEWQAELNLESHLECFLEGKAVTFPALDMWIHAIYYYKDILARYGLDRPETVDDLINMVPILAKDNIWVMSTGFGPNTIVWLPTSMWIEFAIQHSTVDLLPKLEKGEISWEDPIVKEALATIKKMKDSDVFPKDVNSAEYYPTTVTRFQNKKAWSLWIAGDWILGSMNEEDVKNNNIGVMPLPKISADSKLGYGRAAGVMYGMQPGNPSKEIVIDLLKFFGSREAVKVLVNNNIHPTSKLALGIPIKNNLMRGVIEEAVNPDYWFTPLMIARNPEISRRQVEDLGKLFLGMMTVDEVVEDLDQLTKEVLGQ